MVVLAVLVLCSIIFSLTDSTTSNTISNKTIFSVQDTASIDKILIKAPREMIELSKEGSVWMLNDQGKAELPEVLNGYIFSMDCNIMRKTCRSAQIIIP